MKPKNKAIWGGVAIIVLLIPCFLFLGEQFGKREQDTQHKSESSIYIYSSKCSDCQDMEGLVGTKDQPIHVKGTIDVENEKQWKELIAKIPEKEIKTNGHLSVPTIITVKKVDGQWKVQNKIKISNEIER